MKKHRRTTYLTVILTAAICFILMSAVAAFIDYRIAIIGIGMAALLVAFIVADIFSVRRSVKRLFIKAIGMDSQQKTALSGLNLPVVAINGHGEVLWYNDTFKQTIINREIYLESLTDSIPSFNLEDARSQQVQSLSLSGRHYSVYTISSREKQSDVCFSIFFDDTEYYSAAIEYKRTRPCVILFSLDNYEDVMSGASDSDKSAIISNADRVIEDFINNRS